MFIKYPVFPASHFYRRNVPVKVFLCLNLHLPSSFKGRKSKNTSCTPSPHQRKGKGSRKSLNSLPSSYSQYLISWKLSGLLECGGSGIGKLGRWTTHLLCVGDMPQWGRCGHQPLGKPLLLHRAVLTPTLKKKQIWNTTKVIWRL